MDEVHLRRRLTAVLLADVVGYSRLMSADEEGTHARWAEHVKELIEPAVAQYRGRPVRSMGDGMLVEFDSALDAVRCAIEIQRSLAEREANQGDLRIQLRIGINTGDVIVDERDIYGNSINIAARLEGLAEPGQIYVTRGVRDQLSGHPDLRFEAKGERRVKNIDRPIRVYRVDYDWEPGPKTAAQHLAAGARRLLRAAYPRNPRQASLIGGVLLAATAILGMTAPPAWFNGVSPPPRNSIVVMPFNNFSGDPQQGYVADALTDDVTTDLARVKGIFVIAPSTAFTFKGRPVDAREVGKECGVRYLLEGSIIRIGTNIEANIQLIDAATGGHVWADHFRGDLSDLFALQETVTGRIADSLHLQLVRVENRVPERRTDPDATDLRLHAMAYLIDPLTPKSTLAARHDLKKALELDPRSAEAWSRLAYVLIIDFFRGWNNAGEAEVEQAEAAVQNAYDLDQSIAIAHFVDGKIRQVKGDPLGALDALNEALRLDPNLAVAWAQKADELIFLGRAKESPDLVRTAIDLSPRDPDIGLFYWFMGHAYFAMKDYDKAIYWLQKSVEKRPAVWSSRAFLIGAYALKGRLDQEEAKAAVNEYRTKFGEKWPLYPTVWDVYTGKRFHDVHSTYKEALEELLRGLQIAKQDAGFP
jgi:adenylate cyclase